MSPGDAIGARTPSLLRLRAHPLKIALVGNPNVGKSVVFGRLTGRYATVSNYPGTTVAITSGRALVGAEVCDVIDTPGVNALEGVLSEDERITKQLLVTGGAELVIQVADARNLRRALMLTSQIADTGLPMILVLNMVKTRLFTSQILIQIAFGTIVPLAILAATQLATLTERTRVRFYVTAAVLTLIGIFAMRWNVVIGGQLFSKSFLGYTTYKVGFATREGLLPALLVLLLPLGILAVLVKLLPPWTSAETPS